MYSSIRLHSLSFSDQKTWLFAFFFVLGNLILPQIAHAIPQGGLIFLPIYFFTLIAAFKYGIWAGLLTALLSPLANSLLFGMPPMAFLPLILTKSVLLAVVAAYAARYFKNLSVYALVVVVLVYQFAGMAIEFAVLQDLNTALQDLFIGWPGMLLQVLGGYLVLKVLAKY